MDIVVNDLFKTVDNNAEFNNVFKKMDDCHSEKVYFQLLLQIKEAIWAENIDKFKDLCVLIGNIHSVLCKETIRNYCENSENPLKKTNIVILSCLAEKLKILNYIFNRNNNMINKFPFIAQIEPNQTDDENHNAFYYAVRSKNTELLKVIVEKWPNMNDANCLWKMLSEAYEELRVRCVPVLEKQQLYIENKLISLLFNVDDLQMAEFMKVENVEKRLEFLIEKIELLLKHYTMNDKVNCAFLLIARFIVKNIHILKLQLKCTYEVVPWEEMEFFIIVFISAYSEIHENRLFYYTILQKEILFKYLELFLTTLKDVQRCFKSFDDLKRTAMSNLSRESIISMIVSKNPSFADFYQDFRKFQDIYTLNRVDSYIKIALSDSTDINSLDGQLAIIRAYQVLEGSLKNSLDQPNLSPKICEIILFCCSPEIQSWLLTSYFSKSRFRYSDSMDECVIGNITVMKNLIKCLTKIEDFISKFKYNHMNNLLSAILEDILLDDMQIKARHFVDFLQGVEYTSIINKSILINKYQDVISLFMEMNKVILPDNEYEIVILTKIDRLLNYNNDNEEMEDYIIGADAVSGGSDLLSLIKFLVEHIHISNNDEYSCRVTIKSIKRILKLLKPTINMRECHESIQQMLRLCRVAAPRLECNIDDLNIVYSMLLQICFVTDFELVEENWMKTIKEHRTTIQHSNIPMDIDDELTNKLTILYKVLSNNGLESGITNISYLKFNHVSRLTVEMLVTDVISILDEKFSLCDNFSCLDDSITLLSGKLLLNYLLNVFPLADVLLCNPLLAIVACAQKVIDNYFSRNISKLIKLQKNNIMDMSNRFIKLLEIANNQDKMLEAISSGNFEECKSRVENGGDLLYRSQFCQTTLHLASKESNLDVLKYILARKVNIYNKDYNEQNVLHIAAKSGKINLVNFYLNKYEMSINETDKFSQNALHFSAKSGNKELVEFCLLNNSDIFSMDRDNLLAIHYAVASGNIDIVKAFLEAEPMLLSIQTNCNNSLLHVAVANNDIAMTTMLLQHGFDVNTLSNDALTPLQIACIHGNVDIVKVLIENNAKLSVVTGEHFLSPLFYAVQGRFSQVVRILLESGTLDVDFCFDDSIPTPLHIASKNGDLDIVQLLIDCGANINSNNSKGETALHIASFHGHADVVNTLIERGSDVNQSNLVGETGLHLSVRKQHYNVAQLLINKRCNINCKTASRRTPLHIAATFNNVQMVSMLLSRGAYLNSKAPENMTPLNFSVLFERPAPIEIFLKKGAKTSNRFLCDKTSLHLAAKQGSVEIVKMLLKAGVQMEWKLCDGKVPLHMAVLSGKKAIVDMLLERKVQVDLKDNNGHTPLVLAVQGNQVEIAETLIWHGANINLLSSTSETLLCIAVSNNFVNMVDLLIYHGAEVNAKDGKAILTAISLGFASIVRILLKCEHILLHHKNDDKHDLIQIAAINGYSAVLKDLLERQLGASLTSDNLSYKEMSPLYLATLNKHEDCVKVLLDYGADPNTKTLGESILYLPVQKYLVSLKDIYIYPGQFKPISPFDLAIEIGNQSILELFLQINISNNHHKTEVGSPLHYAANCPKNLTVYLTKFVIAKGGDVNEKNSDGLKAIHVAAEKGDFTLVKYYLENYISIDDRGENDWTLLHYAVFNNHISLVNYLLNQKIDIELKDSEGHTALHIAAENNNIACVTALLDNGAIYNPVNEFRKSPFDLTLDEKIEQILSATEKLFAFVYNNKHDGIKKCILEGAKINSRNTERVTPLQCAVFSGDCAMVVELLHNNADPNIPDSWGNPILHTAAKSSNFDIIQTLLFHGAIYNARDTQLQTVCDIGAHKGIADLLKLIDKLFTLLEIDSENIIDYINSITLSEVKVVLNARNSRNKSFLELAIQRNFPQASDLVEILQHLISPQISAAKLLFLQEKYEGNVEVLQGILKEHEEILGSNHPSTLDVKSKIAFSHFNLGNYSEALSIYETIHNIEKRLYDEENMQSLKTDHYIALIYIKEDRYIEALTIFQKNLSILKTISGGNHDEILNTQFYIANILDYLKRYEEALSNYSELFHKCTEKFGEKSDTTVSVLSSLAMTKQHLGYFDEAVKDFQEVYAIRKCISGPTHVETLSTLVHLGTAYFTQGKHEKALNICNEVLEIQKQIFAPNHIHILNSRVCIGNLMYKCGKLLAALKIFTDIEEICTKLTFPYINVKATNKIIKDIRATLSMRYHDDILENANTYLCDAAGQGMYTTVHSLIHYGVDPNVRDMYGRLPLNLAVNCNQESIVRFLLSKGCDATILTRKGDSVLHTATTKSNFTILELLLKHMKQNHFNKFYEFINTSNDLTKSTAMHIACKNNKLTIVKCLLKHGASYNLKDKSNERPLNYTTDNSIINILANLDDLFERVKNGDDKIIDTIKLMDRESSEAVLNARNENFQTLTQIALLNKHKTLAGSLLKLC